MAQFDPAVRVVLTHEGGYVNHPNDPGGETKFGISKRSYPKLEIAHLTREDAKAIYLQDFWLAGSMDQYDGAIGFQVFDAAVNHGIQTALRLLQRAAGVADDGHVGPVTVAAVKARHVNDVLMLYTAERLDFWRKLSTWPTFGKGWAGRAAENLRYAAKDV